MAVRFAVVPRFLAFLLLLVSSSSALAAPVLWRVEDGGNNHFYNVISAPNGITWPDAETATAARGSGWHLATITSPEENAFVYSLLAAKPQFWKVTDGNAQGPWIGGKKTGPGANDVQWVTSEPFTYSNWAAGQPSGIGDRVTLYAPGAPDGPTWRNLGGAQADVVSYVIETEQEERLVAVIEEPTCFGSSGISNIRGFAFSSINGVTIDRVVEGVWDIDADGESEFDIPCCSTRNVRTVYPEAPARTGFSGIFNYCLLSPGKHTITLTFESSSGKTLTQTRDFLSFCATPPEKSFLLAGEFDWDTGAPADCRASSPGVVVCKPDPSVCDGELRYEWGQGPQGLALQSNCVPDGDNPPPRPACSDTVTEEVGFND